MQQFGRFPRLSTWWNTESAKRMVSAESLQRFGSLAGWRRARCDNALMRINAFVQPPEHVVQHLASAVEDMAIPTTQLNWVEPSMWVLPLARFGNVAMREAIDLELLLMKELRSVLPMELRLAAVIPLPENGDDSLWVGIDGDAEQLRQLATAIPRWVRPHGFLLDRRSFRTRMRIGRVTPYTTVIDLERLVERLGHYQGPSWIADEIVMGRPRRVEEDGKPTGYDVDGRIAFGSTDDDIDHSG
jgi:RNA 2',3'-cyclic 3'-phosphodiesterase